MRGILGEMAHMYQGSGRIPSDDWVQWRCGADNLTPEQKKCARRLLPHMAAKKSEWLSVPGFSNNLALLLLEMTSWGEIPMSLEEMVEYMLPFNECLLAWF